MTQTFDLSELSPRQTDFSSPHGVMEFEHKLGLGKRRRRLLFLDGTRVAILESP
jgi:hypothetical protein